MLIPFLGSLLLVLVGFAEHSLSSYSYHFEFTDPWNVLLSYLVQICAQTKDWIHGFRSRERFEIFSQNGAI